jgi:hypothetical protein
LAKIRKFYQLLRQTCMPRSTSPDQLCRLIGESMGMPFTHLLLPVHVLQVVQGTGGDGPLTLFHGRWCRNTHIPTRLMPGTGFQVQMESNGMTTGAAGGLSFFVYDLATGQQYTSGDQNSFLYTVRNPYYEDNRHQVEFKSCSNQDKCLWDMDSGYNLRMTRIDKADLTGSCGYGAYQSGCRHDCRRDFDVVLYWKDNTTVTYGS